MLYHWIYPLKVYWSGFNVLKYISVRMFIAAFIAMGIYFLFGRAMIRWLAARQLWQTVRDDGPVTHMDKRGTPTMGGLLLWGAVIVALLLCGRFDVPYTVMAIGVILAFGAIGFLDDYRKVILKDAKGLRARFKFPLQVAVAAIVVLILFDVVGLSRDITVPFFKDLRPDLGDWMIPFAIIVIVGTSNAVNLTDGLDGLVSMPSIVVFLAYAVIAYITGHAAIASYLQVPVIPGSGELAVVCGAIIGATLGFLWYNAHPASVFMGDVGSLPMGAVLGYVAVVTKSEILLVAIGGLFVLEAVSVITQVISFKLTGKRIFRMAPLHHHFELKGWPESKVIVRFWIITIILALMSLATLKLR